MKSQRDVCVYWCIAPGHVKFSHEENEMKRRFNFCLESTFKSIKKMRVIKLKEWDQKNEYLVSKGCYTELGLKEYWDSVNSAFRFNTDKYDIFLAKVICANNRSEDPPKEDGHHKEEMEDFFRNHKSTYNKFHWHNNNATEDYRSHRRVSTAPRFLLPKLRH